MSARKALVKKKLYRLAALAMVGAGVFYLSDSQATFHATASAFAARFGVEEITAEDLRARLADKRPTLLVDVREEVEQSVSVIPGSISAGPRVDLSSDPRVRSFAEEHASDPSALVVIYCAGGYRSARSLRKLADSLGDSLQVRGRNLHGGIVAHANSGGTLVDPAGRSTQMVHAYNETWARFVLPPNLATVAPPIGP